MNLEQRFESKYEKYNIGAKYQRLLNSYLNVLKDWHHPTCSHSKRVGILSSDAFEALGREGKAGFYFGSLHDIGKIGVDKKILNKKKFTKEDMKEIKEHSINGYLYLKADFPVSALDSYANHRFQKKGYPLMKKPKTELSKKSIKKLEYDFKIVSIIDRYDAMLHRGNNKYNHSYRPLSRDETKHRLKRMTGHDKHMRYIVSKLYEKNILH